MKIVLDWTDPIKAFDFLPGRDDVLVVLTENGLFAVEVDDRSERNVHPIYEKRGIDFRKSENDRIIVKDGNVFYEISL
jgi:hypothetical protein